MTEVLRSWKKPSRNIVRFLIRMTGTIDEKSCLFDRDGVLNVDTGYLYRIEDFHWIDGAKEALTYLTEKDYLISSLRTRAAWDAVTIRKPM